MEDVHPSPPGTVRFGSYEVDLRAGQVRKQGMRIKLQEQPFQILQLLLEHPGEVVTREELRHRIWPSDTFVDFDRGLNNGVKRLREALCDSPENPRYIETIPRRGYRFISEIERPNSNQTSTSSLSTERQSGRFGILRLILIACGFTMAILLMLFVFRSSILRTTFAAKPASIQSIAVLPFENLSGDSNQELFSDGMTDALITDLAQISSLKVVSRTSTLRYRKTDKTIPEIARELNVDGIVEGTVQRSGNRVRITAQLIHAPTDKHVWANSYERGSQDVLGLESEMARAIANQIQSKLTPGEESRLTTARPVNLEAFEDYLQGRYHVAQAREVQYSLGKQMLMQTEMQTARDFFNKAIAADPEYAQPYVGIASTWFDASVAHNGPENERSALEKALQLDPNLAEAHLALGRLAYLRNWDWSLAEEEIRRSLELNPNSADAHLVYEDFLDGMGRFDEGLKEYLRAEELDPGRGEPMPNPFSTRRQFEKAIEMDRNDIVRHAFSFEPHWDMASDYQAMGRHDDAVREWQQCMRILGYDELADEMNRSFELGGYKSSLAAWVQGLEMARSRGENVPSFVLAGAHTYLGEKDRAFAWLEKAYQERDPALQGLKTDPTWDGIRSDERFQKLVQRVGLP